MSSYLINRNYGVELIEMGTVVKSYLLKNNSKNPLILCSDRTRRSGYCDKHFECHYPNYKIQKKINSLIEKAIKGGKIDIYSLLNELPDASIICAETVLNARLNEINDPRWINPNKLLAQYVAYRSCEGTLEDNLTTQSRFRKLKLDEGLSI